MPFQIPRTVWRLLAVLAAATLTAAAVIVASTETPAKPPAIEQVSDTDLAECSAASGLNATC